jgi:hypothetical protein
MTTADEFQNAIARAIAETPYTISHTDEGFDLHLDLANARWIGLYNKAGLKVEYLCRVEVNDNKTYTIDQGKRRIEWSLGTPTRGSIEMLRGRNRELSFEKIWALDERFRPAKVVDYSFSSRESLSLVRTVGKKLGLKERMPGSMRIGLVAGFIGASSLVLVPIGLLGKSRGWWG